MRIGFFSDTWLPNIDGVVVSMINFREELEKRGDKVYVFAPGTEKAINENKDKEIFLFRALKIPPYPQYKLALFPIRAISKAKSKKIQIVHCHGIASMGLAAIATAKRLKLPLVGTFHTMIPLASKIITKSKFGQKILGKLAWKAVREFYRPFNLVITPTQTIKNILIEKGVRNRIEVVSNGVDTDFYNTKKDAELMRKLLGIPKSKKIVLISSRISKEKNIDVIIKAAPYVLKKNDVMFVVQGGGPALKSYMQLVKKKKLEKYFIFTDFLPKRELPFLYRSSDVFVTASTFETQGLVILEAMASGRIPIGANSLAIPELIKEGENGFLFEPFNTKECAEKINYALNLNKREKRRIEANARKTAMNHSIKKSTKKLRALYRELIKR